MDETGRISRNSVPDFEDIWVTLDRIVQAVDEICALSGLPLSMFERITTQVLEAALADSNQLELVEMPIIEGAVGFAKTNVTVPHETVERLVSGCKHLGNAFPKWGAEAEQPFRVWKGSGPGLLVHWLNYRVCCIEMPLSLRPPLRITPTYGVEQDWSNMRQLMSRVYFLAFIDEFHLWNFDHLM